MARDHHEHRAWVRMPSGRRLDLLDPTPFDWDDSDLALGLARTYRWGGHSAWPLPLSVAQHSLTVMHVRIAACTAAGLTLSPLAALRELLHDAEEGLLGFDCISPLKPFLGDAFKILSQKLDAAVFLRYGLPGWTPKEYAAHKLADRLAAASEAVHIAGWSATEVQQTLKITVPPLHDDPLHAIYGGTPWEPWPPALAAERFLVQLNQLKDLCA